MAREDEALKYHRAEIRKIDKQIADLNKQMAEFRGERRKHENSVALITGERYPTVTIFGEVFDKNTNWRPADTLAWIMLTKHKDEEFVERAVIEQDLLESGDLNAIDEKKRKESAGGSVTDALARHSLLIDPKDPRGPMGRLKYQIGKRSSKVLPKNYC